MPNRETRYQTDALFKGLRMLLVSLPTEAEKREVLRTFEETQRFLDELRSLVEAIPTMESSGDLAAGLSRLDILGGRARENTVLRRLLGLRTSQEPNPTAAPSVKTQLHELMNLSEN